MMDARNDSTWTPDAENEADVLIARVIDGEATETDRERFDHLAAAEPTLWRELALRQQDHGQLTEEVRAATAGADRTELPRHRFIPRGVSWTLAASGWAAVLILSLSWGLIATSGRRPAPIAKTATVTPEEHYQNYMEAPYVLGDMHPEVLEVQEMPDGRVAVHFVRRIEEIAFLDPESDLPVDETGELTRDPVVLRQAERRGQ